MHQLEVNTTEYLFSIIMQKYESDMRIEEMCPPSIPAQQI